MKNLFIGMIFIILDFDLNLGSTTIGLLPGFVGYYFILKGIDGFNGEVAAFEKVRQLCRIMTVGYIVTYIMDLLAVSLGAASYLIGLVFLAVNLYVTFNLTEGIFYLEEKYGYLQAQVLRNRWKALVIALCVVQISVFIPFAAFILLIVNLVCAVMFLVAFNTTKNLGINLGL